MNKEFNSFGSYNSELALDFIAQAEGFESKAYKCPAGIWTIGYGHTAGVKQGDTISKEKAKELLKEDLVQFKKEASSLVRVPVTEGMFIAIMSFVYNFGITKCKQYPLFADLNNKNYDSFANRMVKYVNPGSKFEDGLRTRRYKEQALFNNYKE
jgi:lysozyme